MFRTDSNKDRISYSNILLPPAGYKLDQAVGTTYSLDLETLTAVSIALGLREEMDGDLLKNPASMLNAFQKVTDKILIFCEAGQIRASDKTSPLMLLMDKMVIPVALPKGRKASSYPAFHPKTWILRYVNQNGEKKYRFAVLSRNLTFDRSWDISFCMDSAEKEDHTDKTIPIIDFLNYLRDRISNAVQDFRRKRSMLKALAEDLRAVSFSLENEKFEDFTVMPLGIGEKTYDLLKDPLLCQKKGSRDYTFHDLVVVSPFISASFVEFWNRSEHDIAGTNRTLITRKSELPSLKAEQASRFKVYVLKDDIVDGEGSISEGETETQRQDIHAKIYLRMKYPNTDLYLGSMNATESGAFRNVEMMIRLRTKNRHLNGEIFLKELFCGEAAGNGNPFKEVLIQNEVAENTVDATKQLEQILKDICRQQMKAVITENNGKYNVQVSVIGDNPKTWKNVTIAPLRRDVFIPFSSDMLFPEMEILRLTEFYRICVRDKNEEISRVIMIPTVGFPENRENAVVSTIVKETGFIEYVTFILGDDHLMTLLEERTLNNTGQWGNDSIGRFPALYEKMLKAALDDPDCLKEIDYLIRMIEDKTIIPEEFRELYETFRSTLRLK